jgi:acetylornithine/N-succinyldiaminopimelate aminotransferase
MNLFEVYPLQQVTIEKAKGSFLWDNHDVRYLDMYGGHAVISIGHSHPHYVSRIIEQLGKIGFYSNSVQMPLQEELAERLGRVSGKTDYRLFLCNSGAEANENALKLASFHTGRKKIVAFTGAFHGRTSLAVAATDNPSIIAPVNVTENISFLPFNDEQALTTYFKENGDEVAAVITEGIQGVGGIRIASDAFLKTIRSLCDQYGAVFIADSVQCGYGRTGKFFSHDYSGINADIYTMAKGMGNGFPIGGIIIAPYIQAKMGMLGTTFGGNHLACVAASAVLEVIEKEELMKNVATAGAYLSEALTQTGVLENVRGRGLMIGFDVPEQHKDLKKNLLNTYHIFTGEAKPNVIRLLPSLALRREEAGLFSEALQQALSLSPATP